MNNNDKFERNCPKCNKEIIHKNIKDCRKAKKKNLLCNSCVKKGKPSATKGKHFHSEETKEYLRKINIGLQAGC
jgi:hypothetical protein